jgi:hypothetical protein
MARCFGFALACFLLSPHPTSAAPVTADTATSAVQGWLHQDRRPLGRPLPGRVGSTEAVRNAAGEILYYVVRLDPSGFVILPSDDLADPIVAFSAAGSFDPLSGSAVAALVKRDLPRRMARAQARAGAPAASALQSRRKWRAFLAGSPNPPPDMEENGNIVVASQIRVAPLVQTLWNQTVDVSLNDACYNYFTPPYAAGNTNNYPCGCVATALAQEMYYFQYPNTGVGTASFTITNNGVAQTAQLRGGDGAGGVYLWSQMPLSPNNPGTNQAGAIGALTWDAGVAVNMDYTPGDSTAFTYLAQQALTSTFKFANAGYFEDDNNGVSGTNLIAMINPSLDARLPVILGIQPDGGHCLLCDGYGYSASTLFHHLNAGFGGDDDVWYALPDIDTVDGNGDYTLISACIYNIYTNGSGQIISGQVTDPTGAPVTGAMVRALRTGGGTYTATTDTNGIYALARIPAGSTYTLTITNAGGSAATGIYSTGTSVYDQLPSGNVWGANFVLPPPLLAIPETGFAAIGPVGGPFSVAGQIFTLTNESTSAILWTLSNTNSWLGVSSTNGTLAAGAASNLTVSLSSTDTNLPAGTYSGSIWITNQNNGLAQQLTFSLFVKTADYPMAVTGYNLDVVVENTAVGGSTINYADAFDPDHPLSSGPVCFYEAGLVATNLNQGSGAAVLGLPPSGLVTSLVDGATTFQLGPYDNGNVLYLTNGAPSGSLALNSPAACKSLSVLAASAQGGGNGTLVIHFADGTASSNIAFNATDYLTINNPGPGAAMTNFGVLAVGSYNEFGSIDPAPGFPGIPYSTLYQTSIDLQSNGYDTNPIMSVTFTMPTGAGTTTNTVTGVFALSGTAAPYTGNYLLTVSNSPANGGMADGGGNFAPGSTNTVTATADSGYLFADWTLGGNVASTSSNYTFILNASENLVANFLPAYTLFVSASPDADGMVSGGGTFPQDSLQTVTVTATANSGFEFIGWSGDATGTINPLTVTVSANLNITANFAAIGTNITLTVLTNGDGIVSPNLNGRILKKGRNYTLTATAKSTNVFVNWTGTITAKNNPLTIEAESSMVLQANFIPNPFLPVKGTYNGIFSMMDGVTEGTAGMLRGLTISQNGTYSGTLLINGASHAVSGRFDLTGQAGNYIARTARQGGPLQLALTLDWDDSPPQLTGTVSVSSNGVVGGADLIAYRASNALPSAEYTMLLPSDVNSAPANSPGGDSYALITNHLGTARISGALADGTAFSQTVPVSQDGLVPVYANLYGGNGLLLGWINLAPTNSEAVAATGLTWIHPERAAGLYREGFTNVLTANQIQLSLWTNPPPASMISSLTNLSILDTINDTNALLNFAIAISPTTGEIGPAPVSGSLNPKTGYFKVTLGTGAAKTNGYGAILLNASNGITGGGYLLTGTNAQAVKLQP